MFHFQYHFPFPVPVLFSISCSFFPISCSPFSISCSSIFPFIYFSISGSSICSNFCSCSNDFLVSVSVPLSVQFSFSFLHNTFKGILLFKYYSSSLFSSCSCYCPLFVLFPVSFYCLMSCSSTCSNFNFVPVSALAILPSGSCFFPFLYLF